MIDSPTQHVEDLRALVEKSKYTTSRRLGQKAPEEREIQKKTADVIRGGSLTCYFLRISWTKKLYLVTEFVRRIQNVESILLLLGVIHSVTGKITTYWICSPITPIVYDKMLCDHDRMLDSKTVDRVITADIQWFETLSDKEQVSYLITVLRHCGGAIIRLLHHRLQAHYRQRLQEKPEPEKNVPEILTGIIEKPKQSHSFILEFIGRHDPQDPKHQKVLELEKSWNDMMKKFKKKLEKQMPKTKTKESEKKKKGKKKKGKGKSSKGSKSKSSKGSKSKSSKGSKKKKNKKNKKADQSLDWVQLMPIWIVKKIFNYLDKKTLNKAKKVNGYWKWAIGELLKDRKAIIALKKSNKKLKETTSDYHEHDNVNNDDKNEYIWKTPKPRVSHTERRLKKLEQRGAILKKMRLIKLPATNTSSLLVDVIKLSESQFADDLTIFPRVARINPPLYKKPDYIFKDVNIICETRDVMSDSEDDVTPPAHICSVSFTGSDDEINHY